MQLLVVRNAIACVICAVTANACHYYGNIFSLKASTQQSRPEMLMATLVWSVLLRCSFMLVAHVPLLKNQRFLQCPETQPTIWFCTKKLARGSFPYFIAALAGKIGVGLLVQNTDLMYGLFAYKLHFYLGAISSLTFSAGVTFIARRIYYEETCRGYERRRAMNDPDLKKSSSAGRNEEDPGQAGGSLRADCSPGTNLQAISGTSTRYQKPTSIGKQQYRKPTFWRAYVSKLYDVFIVILAGAFVHAVSEYRILNQGTAVVMSFAGSAIMMKIAFQEMARWYILKKKIRSIYAMYLLVGVPTVLIDTQARIVLLGTQTNPILVTGTCGMAVAEVFLRAGKAAFVVWTIHCRAKTVKKNMQELSKISEETTIAEEKLTSSSPPSCSPPSSSLQVEFELWRRQILSYHSAEITADMYAEYIAIGCSQSIVFWYTGHPYYPALQLVTGSEVDVGRWQFNQIAMLGFQFVVEVFVDYICVVMEMAAGIEFERAKDLSAFVGMLFTLMAVLNISISATVYLS
ncbi:hypothetical protein PHYBOEH_006011 [Phytophthora boehmeriae]|uniref:Transmembrane protein n=1 Tax=Phytophthora boehmeriae TaxID=109152 RepID=A0A8T1WKK8_9STRA|nr:hypothetical protein PHYBOEH_006011 [Phytophthora boehmeriae]